MTREALSNRRTSFNFTIDFQGERYNVTAGYYENGRLGEIFINRIRDRRAAKLGQHLDAACRDAAIVISMLLQHGADLEDLEHSVTRDEENAPMSILGVIVDALSEPKSGGQEAPVLPDAPSPAPSPAAAEPVLEQA